MNPKDEIWVKTMNWFAKYGGCHQMPERSFFFRGYQFPLCARCTGIALGYILGVLFWIFNIQLSLLLLLIFFFSCALDGVIQYFTRYTSTNPKRFVLGILCGISIVHILFKTLSFIYNILI